MNTWKTALKHQNHIKVKQIKQLHGGGGGSKLMWSCLCDAGLPEEQDQECVHT